MSDRLGEGIKLVPMKEEIHENAIAASDFIAFQDYTSSLLRYLKDGTITDWKRFLETAISPLKSGNIHQRPNTPLAEVIGNFNNCNAMTVYKRNGKFMRLCGSCGNITPNTEYELNNKDSYVVSAYIQDTTEIGYSNNKKLLYYTIRTAEFVLCFHYPLEGYWDNEKVEAFNNEIDCAIIQNTLFTDFLADLIGGIQYEY